MSDDLERPINDDETDLEEEEAQGDAQDEDPTEGWSPQDIDASPFIDRLMYGNPLRIDRMSPSYPGTTPSVKGGSRDHLVVEPAWTDPRTGATYIHKDLVEGTSPWAHEEHVSPAMARELLGDVKSWCTFVDRYGFSECAHLTWNKIGLKAILDWHGNVFSPGRAQFLAEYRFVHTRQLDEWLAFASGNRFTQAAAVERLENLVGDIREPDPGHVIELLQVLKGHASSRATSQLRTDGTTALTFESDRTLNVGATDAVLPSFLVIGIPLLVGNPDLFPLKVRIRAEVTDQSGVVLRFGILNLEAALERAYLDLVDKARELLTDGWVLLRAADPEVR